MSKKQHKNTSYQDKLMDKLVKKPAPVPVNKSKLRKSHSNGRDEEQ